MLRRIECLLDNLWIHESCCCAHDHASRIHVDQRYRHIPLVDCWRHALIKGTGTVLLAALALLATTDSWAWHHHYVTASGARNTDAGIGNPGIIRLNIVAHATVAFSPDGGGEQIIVNAINGARNQILVQAYGFTDKAILGALVQAKRRGVDVRVILDKSNDKGRYSGANYVANAGIPVWIDDKPAIAHNKVMIIDHNEVVTGSFNFTASAQTRNAENVLILGGAQQLADAYIKDWNWRLRESRAWT